MKFNLAWLAEWVKTDLAADELSERLTMGGLEVDGVTPAGATLDGVVAARIISAEQHPDADRLRVCQVDAGGDEPVQIVCGAPNAAAGLVAPLATVGTVLPGGLKIKPAKLRGVESHGMLCSANELELAEDADGLLPLPGDAEAGTPLTALLGLDDQVIEVDLTPNRGDCLSILGIAQDVAALTRSEFTPLEVPDVPVGCAATRSVTLDQPSDCARYVGRVIQGINNRAETPLWMAEKLRRCGLRCIHPVVDVTNYVMLELGQPLHAFDASTIEGPVSVRRARTGETLTLLDGTEADLEEDMVVITDADRPVATAGLMGGLGTAVTEDTADIFLESAWFDPAAIIGRARRLGVHSDAAHRFERGVDPQGQVRAIERASALLTDIAGGECGPLSHAVREAELPSRAPVTLRLARLARLTGFELTADKVMEIFKNLGMAVEAGTDAVTVTPPPRRFDIDIEEDLVEEVARIYGYDQLREAIPTGDLPAVQLPEGLVSLRRIQGYLADAGLSEAITFSFRNRSAFEPLGDGERALGLANPLSADLAAMRTSLVPGLLHAAAHNLNRQQPRVALFESGHCFVPATAAGEGAVTEVLRLAGVAAGRRGTEQWLGTDDSFDFYDAKGWVEGLLDLGGAAEEFTFEAGQRPYLHPGQQAELLRSGEPAGWIGTLHPNWSTKSGIRGPVVAFEVDLAPICAGRVPVAQALPRYPSVRRDLNVVVNKRVSWYQIAQIVQETVGNLLTSLVVFDEYTGQGITGDQRSLSFGLILRDNEKTLTDESVDGVMSKVVTRLNDQLGAELRG
ncbi:MAG: phenylalanine--tRNA ligase subunit beta [Pseudomonadota bacterium]